MPSSRPRRTSADPEGLRLFVRLARIAVVTADADDPSHAELRRELHLLEQESERARPRPALTLARVDEVVAGFGGVVSAETGVLLDEARDDVHRAHRDLWSGEVPEAG